MTPSLINIDFTRKHRAQAVLTVLGLSGVVLLFLPFAYDVIPATVLLYFPPPLPPFGVYFVNPLLDWWVTVFVLLPFAISGGYLRWLLKGRLSRVETGVGYALALIAACSLVVVTLVERLNDPSDTDWLYHQLGYPIGAFSAGAWLVVLNLRGAAQAPNALVAMQVVYVPLALFLIVLGFDFGPQISCYLTTVPVVVYSAQIVIAANRRWQALIFFVPLALLWAGLLALDR